MANQLEITSVFKDSKYRITSKVSDTSDSDFPRDIFLWTLDEKGALSAFQSIGQIDQVAKYKLYDSTRTSNFGIHLVRYNESVTEVDTEVDKNKVIIVLKKAFDNLTRGYDIQSEPVTEVYP